MTGTPTAALTCSSAGEVAVGRADEPVDAGEVAERLGELLGALLERAAELELLGQDLLLEQRRAARSRRPRRCSSRRRDRRVAVVRGGRGHDRRAEVEPEIGGAQIDGHASCSLLVGGGRVAATSSATATVSRCVECGRCAPCRPAPRSSASARRRRPGPAPRARRPAPGASAARIANRVSLAANSAIGIDGLARVELERLCRPRSPRAGSGTAASSRCGPRPSGGSSTWPCRCRGRCTCCRRSPATGPARRRPRAAP